MKQNRGEPEGSGEISWRENKGIYVVGSRRGYLGRERSQWEGKGHRKGSRREGHVRTKYIGMYG